MLEMLLIAYKDAVGEEFPLNSCTDMSELELINIIYDCVQSNRIYAGERTNVNKFPTAPRS